MGANGENTAVNYHIVAKSNADALKADNFIIGDIAYTRYEDGNEPVLVYNPHFYIHHENEQSCFATLLLHLPWGEYGEKGLLHHPVLTKDNFSDPVSAYTYHMSKKSSFPHYVKALISQTKVAEQKQLDRELSNNTWEECSRHILDNDDGQSIDSDTDSTYNNYIETGYDNYLRSSGSESDSTSIQHDESVTYQFQTDSRVQKVLTVASKLNYHSFLKTHRDQMQAEYERSNEAPATSINNDSSYISASIPAVIKYPNHDEMKAAFIHDFNNRLGNDQRNAVRRIVHSMKIDVSENPDKQLLFFLSGAGGTGKSECIKLLQCAAKLIFGMKGPYEPLICVAPTGSAACHIGGYTWQSILNVDRKNGILQQHSALKLANRLRGTHVIIVDEISLLGCSDLYIIHENLQAARKCSWAISNAEISKRELLSKLPFGGYKIVFAGDFYQLPPVLQRALYIPNRDSIIKPSSIRQHREFEGRKLWEKVTQFYELKENFRFKAGLSTTSTILAQFLDGARVGCPDPNLLRHINTQCLVSDISRCHADRRALWMAPNKREVEEYNQAAFHRLNEINVPKYRALARHVISGNTTSQQLLSNEELHTISRVLFGIDSNPASNNMHGPMPPADIKFVIGQRVRVTKNLATQLGVYQGALGTIHGFLFDTSHDLNDQIMWPTGRIPNWKLALSKRQDNVPVVLVKMDKLRKDISCVAGESRIIPFCQETHQVPITVRGNTYYRCQYPLLPAQATTMHKSQGLTASYGAVFQPNKTSAQSHFGLHYVALSRVTTIEKQQTPPYYDNLTLLTYPLQVGHFTSHPLIREYIHIEYNRLRKLAQQEADNISFS
jgi:PIF1-like helicase